MRIVEAMKESTLRLGYQGEDERTRVVFDLSDLIDEFGVGTVTLLVVRPWEREGSPVVVSRDEDGLYYWDVTDADLQNEGNGEAQITFIPDAEERIAKTHIWKTIVSKSISESENPPEPWQGWVDQVLEAAAEVESAVREIPALIDEALQEAKESGEFDGRDGTDGTDGVDGFSPTVAVVQIAGGHRLTITDVNGTRTVDVMDGEDAPRGTYYGSCSFVDSGTGECVVDSDEYELGTGRMIAVAFSVDVMQFASLNVNNTGAKPIQFIDDVIHTGVIFAGDKALFVYDGDAYNLLSVDIASNPSGGGGGGGSPFAVATNGTYTGYYDVSIPGIVELREGLSIKVKFPNGLNVGGSYAANRLKVNELPAPDDSNQFYSNIRNLPPDLISGAIVLDLTYAYDSYNGYGWFVNYPKFAIDPAPPKMGLGFYYEAATRTAGGGPGQPVYTISEVTVPDDFQYRDASYRVGAQIVVRFDADVKDNGQISTLCNAYSGQVNAVIYFRGSPITEGIIKQGDTCMFALRYDETTCNFEWILLSNDRWGVGVS